MADSSKHNQARQMPASEEPQRQDVQTEPPAEQPAGRRGKKKSPADTWIKLGFVVVLIAATVLIYMHQRSGPSLNWEEDFKYVIEQARKNQKIALVFFHADPPSLDAKEMIRRSLTHSQVTGKIEEFGVLTARAKVAGTDDEVLEVYGVQKLPAIVIFNEQGGRAVNESGFVGHADLTKLLVQTAEGD